MVVDQEVEAFKSEAIRSIEDTTELSELEADVKLIIHNPKTGARLAFGPGVASICYGIKKTGTLSEAASMIGMSYSKAWKIVGEAEDALGIQLIIRKKPQGCWLTPKGEELLAGYMKISKTLSKRADTLFTRIFGSDE